MQWKHVTSPTPTKFKVVQSAGKVMATVFWDMKGVLLVEFQRHGQSVNAASYCALLERLKKAILRKRRGLLKNGVILLHDNARPHTARLTQETIDNLGFEVLPHPLYSPDLAPSDYHLFGLRKPFLENRNLPTFKQTFVMRRATGGRWLNVAVLPPTAGA